MARLKGNEVVSKMGEVCAALIFPWSQVISDLHGFGRKHIKAFGIIAVSLILWAGVGSSQATNLITNGDFETSDLTRWTLVTTDNGIVPGGVSVVQFDASNSNTTFAAELSVGHSSMFGGVDPGGGGLLQSFYLAQTVDVQLSVQVATQNTLTEDGDNLDGGTFEIVLDGQVLTQWASGEILGKQGLRRDTLSCAATNVSAGNHELEIDVLRAYQPAQEIKEYIANVIVEPIPEPSTFALAGLGVVALLALRRRK